MKLTDLPDGAQRLPKEAVTSWTISAGLLTALSFTIPGTFLLVGSAFGDNFFWVGLVLAILVAVLGIIYAVVIPRIRHRYTFFRVSHDEVMIQQGAIFVRRVVVPFARIQNIETIRGPLDRKLGLTNVKIFTAASPVEISCVENQTGEQIRDEMIAKVKEVRDDLVS